MSRTTIDLGEWSSPFQSGGGTPPRPSEETLPSRWAEASTPFSSEVEVTETEADEAIGELEDEELDTREREEGLHDGELEDEDESPFLAEGEAEADECCGDYREAEAFASDHEDTNEHESEDYALDGESIATTFAELEHEDEFDTSELEAWEAESREEEQSAAHALAAGSTIVEKVPLLRQHSGIGPDLILTWNGIGASPSAVDVVVHLHGYALSPGSRLHIARDLKPRSGLDWSDPAGASTAHGRTRPTLALLPRGHFYGGQSNRAYSFPALTTVDGIRELVDYGLRQLATSLGVANVVRGRLILTAHSGGGAALLRILRFVDPHEVHVFDALYQDAEALTQWATRRIERDRAILGMTSERQHSYMVEQGGALRVLFGGGTAPSSRAVARSLATAMTPDSPLRPWYRVERTATTHLRIPPVYGWRLLADASADLPNATAEPESPAKRAAQHEFEDQHSFESEGETITRTGAVVSFPSGATLPVIIGPATASLTDDYYDPVASGNPLLDTSGANKNIKLSASFSVRELTTSGGTSADVARIDPKLVDCLQRLRDHLNKGITITSGFRSWKRNRDVYAARHKRPTLSQHCAGRAADIKISGMNGREIGKAAIDAYGPNIGVGLGDTYAHIDVRGVPTVWNYGGATEAWVAEVKRYQKEKTASQPAQPTHSPVHSTISAQSVQAAPSASHPVSAQCDNAVIALVQASPLAKYSWPGRGRAPIGYLKGMGLSWARVYSKWLSSDSSVRRMARADSGDAAIDALTVYRPEYTNLHWNNAADGVDTLRHLFTMLIGLGMRESAGRYCEGRDMSAHNVDPATAEAGLFQMSYSIGVGSESAARKPLHDLYNELRRVPYSGRRDVFSEGVHCTAGQLGGFGASEGGQFREFCVMHPGLSAEIALLGLRMRRSHWGPVNKHTITLNPDGDALLTSIQRVVDAGQCRTTAAPSTSGVTVPAAKAPTGRAPAANAPAAKSPDEILRFAQRVLNAAEHERLDTDGRLGAHTQGAVERFRSKYALGPGAVLDERTRLALAQRALEELAQQSMFQLGVLDEKTRKALTEFRIGRLIGPGATLDVATMAALGQAVEQRSAGATPARRPSVAASPARTSTGAWSLGIDTASVADNRNPNWAEAKTHVPMDFAIIRSNWGVARDSVFARDWPKMKEAGIVRGAYLFLRFPHPRYQMKAPDPASQARAMIATVGALDESDLPPSIDVEFPGDGLKQTGMTPQQCLDGVRAAWRVLKDHYGVAPIVYTSARVWHEDLHDLPAPDLIESPLWLARYPYKKGPAIYDSARIAALRSPPVPPPWGDKTNWWIHQYQGDAVQLPGFPTGNVDLNKFNVMRRGETGDRVKWVQRRLGIAETGSYDEVMEGTVRLFQRSKGLEGNGVIGASTFAHLCWSHPAT